jgi:hypothetical protein
MHAAYNVSGASGYFSCKENKEMKEVGIEKLTRSAMSVSRAR